MKKNISSSNVRIENVGGKMIQKLPPKIGSLWAKIVFVLSEKPKKVNWINHRQLVLKLALTQKGG